MPVGVSTCQYMPVLLSSRSPVTLSSSDCHSDSVIQWLSFSDSVIQSTQCFCLRPSCLKIFGLCLIIQSQSLQTSAFRLKSSVMFTYLLSIEIIILKSINLFKKKNQSFVARIFWNAPKKNPFSWGYGSFWRNKAIFSCTHTFLFSFLLLVSVFPTLILSTVHFE